jgi:K+-transporting ATPase ATPase A chain
MAGLAQAAALVALLAVTWKPLGDWMGRVYTDTRHWRIERFVYRVCRIDAASPQRWTTYAAGVLGFSFVSIALLYLMQRLQAFLPLGFDRGTDGASSVSPAMAFNTAVSFVTNTNWQSYVPEQVLGHTVQMAGLTVQNVVSAAVGMAVAVALVRGFVSRGDDDGRIGNFWVDLTRGVTRILLPVAVVAAVALVATGVVQSLRSGVEITAVDGSVHTLPLAPAASQEAIKELGTNGGGIFNANSAHPFENPGPVANLLEIFLLLVIPVALTRTFGVMVGRVRQGVVLLSVMGGLWALMLAAAWLAETHPNGPAALAAGGALEGKEVRFGIPGSVLFAVSTTGTSTGAVNSMHDSYSGAAGGVTLLNMLLGEVAPGGGRSGPLRPARARRHRGVPRRTDGRPDPGVPRQEALPPRDHLRRGVDPGHAGVRAAGGRSGDRSAGHRRRPEQRWGARLLPRSSTPGPRPPTTTARRSPGSP